MNIFLSAIGTDSGKTLISTLICKALNYDYWKPVQSGEPRDTAFLESFDIKTFREKYLLKTPESPHAAAEKDGVKINVNEIKPPKDERLLIEGAGGLMVPLNDENVILDIPLHLDIPVILVSNIYLGSINHTLLSLEILKSKGVKVLGVIFNGNSNPDSERIIELKSGIHVLGRIPQFEN